MLFTFCILAVFTSEVFTTDFGLLNQEHYDVYNAEAIYNQFYEKYGAQYNKEKTDHRLNVFKENLKKINKWNRESDSARFGVNQFTDLTFEEITRTYLGVRGNVSTNDAVLYTPKGLKGPESLDYRQHGYVTPVKNQGQCGSCYAFGAIGDVEGQYAKLHQTQAISLSEQQVVDCDSHSFGCSGGWPHWVFQALVGEGGSMRQEHYPYEAVQGQCRSDRSKIAVRVTGGYELKITSEEALKDALLQYGPLAIATYVGNQFFYYQGGVFNPTDCTEWGHALLLVGYGNDGMNDYWLIKNSWDTTWGEQGYMRLAMGQKACGIGAYVAHSIVA